MKRREFINRISIATASAIAATTVSASTVLAKINNTLTKKFSFKARQLDIYKCNTCGNMVEIIHAGLGKLVCCGQPMVLMQEKTVDVAKEKHVPVIEKIDGGVKVKVGKVTHPMEEKHFVEWIEIIADGKAYRQFLNPGDAPEATFLVEADQIIAREFCNLHGVWKA